MAASNQQIGKDLAAIGHVLLPFAIAGAITVIIAGTPLYPLAYGIIAVALVYGFTSGKGSSILTDLSSKIGGH